MSVDKSRVSRCVSLSLIVLVALLGLLLLLQLAAFLFGPSKAACTKQVCLAKFLEGPPAFNNEAMRNYLRKNYFKLPTNSEYSLSGYSDKTNNFENIITFIKEYFKNKRGGVFVELGAGDGEYRSYTLPLERDLQWSGLLVEPNPTLYNKLLKKGRKAHLSKTCVSPYSYPAKMKMSYPRMKEGLSEEEQVAALSRTRLDQLWSEDSSQYENFEAQCVPLENLVYAAGITSSIDLLVLDMSGTDLDVLLSTKMDQLPEFEMILINGNGVNIGSDVGGYFLERNMVIKRVFGDNAENASFVLIKFDARRDL